MSTELSRVSEPGGRDHPLQDIQREVAVLLHRVRREADGRARLVHPDLQPTGHAILLLVCERGPIHAAEIAERLGLDKGAISRQVGCLEGLGLLERTTDPVDRRAYLLALSEAGQRRLGEANVKQRIAFAGRLGDWSGDELADFADKLAHYNAALEGHAPAAR